MPVYTVHGPVAAVDNPHAQTDKLVFVRDGFHFWAFIGGPIWLIYHRLWLALLGYVVALVVVGGVMSLLGSSSGVRFTVMALIALLMGFEAASLRRWTLSRRKWRQLDVVVASDLEAAERRFFGRWTAGQSDDLNSRNDDPHHDRLPPVASALRPLPGAPGSIIGSFPEPGVSR